MEQKILLIEIARSYAELIESNFFGDKTNKQLNRLYEAIKNYEDAV
jgi:L-asparaginase II